MVVDRTLRLNTTVTQLPCLSPGCTGAAEGANAMWSAPTTGDWLTDLASMVRSRVSTSLSHASTLASKLHFLQVLLSLKEAEELLNMRHTTQERAGEGEGEREAIAAKLTLR